VCGKVLSTPSSLKRHLARVHNSVEVGMTNEGSAATLASPAATEPQAPVPAHGWPSPPNGHGAWPAQASPTANDKALYKKKRFYIPVAVVAGLMLIGAVSPSPATTKNSKTAAVSTSDQAQAPVDTEAAEKAAADQAAADKAAADKAAADKAAADKAAAKKAAAEKAAAAKAAAEKAAAEKAAAAKAAAAREAAARAAGTVAQQNAAAKAADYLAFTSFSRSSLIQQLEFEGFSAADATWGVDKQHANWNEQAAAKAKDYLAFTSFSRSSLIQQLEFDGFTATQARYGVDQTGL
jgi:flagellar biosynthesis GTPase FlhF